MSFIKDIKNQLKDTRDLNLSEFFRSLEKLRLLYHPEKDYDYIFNTYSADKIINNSLQIIKTEKSNKILEDTLKNKKHKCLAPFTTLNFDSTGSINVCCYNRTYSIGQYPDTTPYQAWFGDKLKTLRNQLQNLNFNYGCDLCKHQIINNNYENSLLKKFEVFQNSVDIYPINFEFEFSNICNYECIMCGGKWSSSIRKNREKLDPIKTPYGDKFLEDIENFLPHLKCTRFLGGEPFLTPIYYKIFDKLAEVNNRVYVHITSNGSICNSRILNYKNKLPNFGVVLSIDSLQKDTYELIRKNGNFNNVLSNIHTFHSNKMLLGIAFSPLIQNVYEMPDIIKFCIEKNIIFSYNNVYTALGGKVAGIHENGKDNKIYIGDNYIETNINLENKIPEFCLSTLSNEEINKIIEKFKEYKFPHTYQVTMNSFINYLTALKK